jgi:hypothetical protein
VNIFTVGENAEKSSGKQVQVLSIPIGGGENEYSTDKFQIVWI